MLISNPPALCSSTFVCCTFISVFICFSLAGFYHFGFAFCPLFNLPECFLRFSFCLSRYLVCVYIFWDCTVGDWQIQPIITRKPYLTRLPLVLFHTYYISVGLFCKLLILFWLSLLELLGNLEIRNLHMEVTQRKKSKHGGFWGNFKALNVTGSFCNTTKPNSAQQCLTFLPAVPSSSMRF